MGYTFGFCKTFEKVTKNSGSHKTLKTNDLQKIVYNTKVEATVFEVTFDNLNLFVPSFIPSTETQVKFSQSIESSFTPSFVSWTAEAKVLNRGAE